MTLRPYDDFWSWRRSKIQMPLRDSGMTSWDLMTSDDWLTPRRDFIRRRYKDDRMWEVEKKFDDMVRKVDSRFSGLFSLLDEDEFFGKKKTEVVAKEAAATSSSKDFSLKIDVQDFRPEEVKVKVQGGQVFVHAKRENKNEGDGMYAYSFREFKKAFTVPQGVDVERLTSSLTSTGILQIDAPGKSAAVGAIEAPKSVPVTVEHGDK